MKKSRVVGIILFPIFCVLLSSLVLISDPGFPFALLKTTSPVESVQPTHELFQYFFGLGNIPEVFDASEQSHLADVKHVIVGALLVFVLVTVLLCYSLKKGDVAKIARYGSVVLILMLGASVLVPFDALFTWFHELFFPQGNWVFSASSTLIQFYPFAYFEYFALAIAIHACMVAGVLVFFSRMVRT